MKKIRNFIMFLAVTPLLITGCTKETKQATSSVQFKMIDAPAHFDALNIDVQGIMAHTSSGGWVTLTSSLGSTNILNYVNGNATLVAQGNLPAGTLDQIKLMLGSNNSVVVNGNTINLSASGSQAGLTINLNNELQAGANYVWTIDFDAAQSVISGADSGSFQLNPVIRLIVDQLSITGNVGASGSGGGGINVGAGGSGSGGINVGASGSGSGGVNIGGSGSGSGSVVVNGAVTGNISGSVGAAGLASICATSSNGTSVCTMTGLSGNFSIQALGAGTYSVTVTPMISILAGAKTISNITVTAGQTTNLGVVAL